MTFRMTVLFRPELYRFRPLAALVRFCFERNPHTFCEVLQAGLLQSRDVDEDVVPAAVRLDEPETLLFVEEFDSSDLTHHVVTDLLLACSTIAYANCTCGALSYAIKVF